MKPIALHWKILIGMILGVIFGFTMLQFDGGAKFVNNLIKPLGIIFIKLLKLIAIPLILASLIKGVSDLKDISKRLLRNLIGATAAGTAFLDEPKVLVSEDLSPSDTASLDRSKLLAIATDTGGMTSHAVIMARASGVPAVVGLRGLSEKIRNGDYLLIDGLSLIHI